MAEAVAALGVAAAAVQFFDFSLKTLSLCKQIRDSEKGVAQANQELESCMKKLKEIFEELNPNVNLTVANRPITKARQDCVAVIGDLEKLLHDVKLKSSDKKFSAVKAAFRVMKGKRRIEVLQNKLSEAQRRFLAAVSMETKNDVAQLLEEQGKINDTMQNTILPELLKTHASSTSGHAKTHKKLEDTGIASSSAHKTTHSMLANVQRDQKASGKQTSTMQSALSGEIAQIESRADKTYSTAQTTTNHKAFLDSLWYAEIFDRQQTIKPPSFDTFEWIFDDSILPEDISKLPSESDRVREMMRGSFARWLRDDERLFWISGKVGSGKSSLMSLIQDDPRTGQALAGWTQGRRLHTFSFYFWRPGSPLQRRIHGLLRSLLYQLVKAKPTVVDLISSLRPVTQSDWTTKSLITAFRCALPAFGEDRIFLMVDGLDEYEDQYTDLLDLLLECQQMEFIKLCIASRPETAILAKLNTFPSLRLQDLNEKDIDVFVRGKLGPHTDAIAEGLISDLIYRADGVFLWAVLVTNSMVSGVMDGDDVETLKKRLQATPSEINALFDQLLGKIDEVHYDTLKFCFFHLDERKWSSHLAVRCSVGLITASLLASRAITTTTTEFVALCVKNSERLVSLCKGLVEIGDYTYSHERNPTSAWTFDFTTRKLLPIDLYEAATCWTHRIRFVHRSAHDFLFGPERHHKNNSPWALGSSDLHRLTCLTFTGLKTLLRFSPMVFKQPSYFACPDFADYIQCAARLVKNIKGRESIDILSWLDDMYRNLGIWYPIERRSVGPSDIWMTGSEPPWSVEIRFWYGSLSVSGYLKSRWDVLVRNPYARGICSGLLRKMSPHFSVYANGSIYKRLSTFLEEGPIETLTPSLQHLRKTWDFGCKPDELNSTQVSWDASVPLNEQHVIANLMHVALLAIEYPEREKREVMVRTTVFPALLRRHKIFIGRRTLPRRERFMLNIQIPSHTAWKVLRASGRVDATLDYPNHFRLLCLANCDETPLERIHEGCWTPCTEGVVGLCDIDLEALKPLMKPPSTEDYFPFCVFPRVEPFEGTQDQFLCCLEEVKQEVWANKKGQLDAWQQLCMLVCVKKNFGHFWNIITPETHELAQINL
jgi:hypothetical protein